MYAAYRPSPKTQARVLLVDDRPENLIALEAVLEPLGHRMVTAKSGAEALRQLLQDEFALILLDVQMPEMDGIETATRIRQREKTNSVPIVFITAHEALPECIARAYSAGAVDYITKPFDPTVLRSKVRALLELHVKSEQIRAQAEAQRLRLEERQRVFMRDVLASVTEGRLLLCHTPEELPVLLKPVSRTILLNAPGSLQKLRSEVRAEAEELGFDESRWQDLVTAVGEAGMNAVRHGAMGKGRVYSDEMNTIQVWIEDAGPGIDLEHLPRATIQRGYTTAVGSLGHGFWLILRTIDRIWLHTHAVGTTVVLEQGRTPPLLEWL